MRTMVDFAKKAEEISRKAHEGQTRKDGITLYIVHPERVASQFSNNPDLEAIAWLHDVLEDTNLTPKDLVDSGIPSHIVEVVEVTTKSCSYKDIEVVMKEQSDLVKILVKLEPLAVVKGQ